MTIQELYEWAIESDCVDYEINIYGQGRWIPISIHNLYKEEDEEGKFVEIG